MRFLLWLCLLLNMLFKLKPVDIGRVSSNGLPNLYSPPSAGLLMKYFICNVFCACYHKDIVVPRNVALYDSPLRYLDTVP